MQDLAGRKLGQYELRERLGRGGMAEVYQAYQSSMDRFVAVKVMLPHLVDDDQFIQRFQREAQAVGKLRHPHIVQIFDFGIDDKIYFMAMEFIQGGTLKEHIRARGKLPALEAVAIASQMADALDYAHKAGMIHRDLKPANIMFTDEAHKNAVLTDFGIARILGQSGLTMSGMSVGTPAYMSPEAGRGESTDERADIYALGVILYEMLTGRAPYDADTPLAVVMKHINAPLPTRKEYGVDIPEQVERIIIRSMAKEVTDRYSNAAEMQQALDAALSELQATKPSMRAVTPDDDVPTTHVPITAQPDPTRKVEQTASTEILKKPTETAKPTTPVVAPSSSGRGVLTWAIPIVVIAVIAVILLVLSQGGTGETTPIETAVAATTSEPTEDMSEAVVTNEPTEVVTDEVIVTDEPTEVATDEVIATDEPTGAPTEVTIVATLVPSTVSVSNPDSLLNRIDYVAPPHPDNLEMLSSINPLMDEIEALLLQSDEEAAYELVNTRLAENPDDIEALFARVELLAPYISVTDESGEALATAERIRELDPDIPLGYIALFDAYLTYPAYDDVAATEIITEGRERFPDNPHIAWRYSYTSGWETSFEHAQAAEALGGRGYRFMFYYSDVLMQNNDYLRALPYMITLIESDTWIRDDFYFRQNVMGTLILTDQADMALELAESVADDLTEANQYAAIAFVAYQAGDFGKAKEWADFATALADDIPEARWIQALLAWYQDKDFDEAMRIFDELEDHEEFYTHYLNLNFNHDLILDRARIALAAGDVERAIAEYTRMIEREEWISWLYAERAEAYVANGDLALAQEDLRQAFDLEDNPDARREIRNRLQEVSEMLVDPTTPDETPASLLDTLEHEPPPHPENLDILSGISPFVDEMELTALRGDDAIAFDIINERLEANPDDIEALFTLAELYAPHVGAWDGDKVALTSAQRIYDLDSESPLGYIALFDAHLTYPDYSTEAAQNVIAEGLSLFPDNPQIIWRAAFLGDQEQEGERLQRAEELGASGYRFMRYRQNYATATDQFLRAIPYYVAIIESGTRLNGFDVQKDLMKVLILSDQRQAAFDFAVTLQDNLNEAEQFADIAFVAFEAEQYGVALEWANDALAIDEFNPEGRWMRALALWKTEGAVDEPLEILQSLTDLDDFYPYFLTMEFGHHLMLDRAHILMSDGQFDAAVEAYSAVIEEYDWVAWLYVDRALAYRAAGELILARDDLRRAFELSEDPEFRREIGDLLQEVNDLILETAEPEASENEDASEN